MAKVRLDRENCIGCSACAGLCPRFWVMGDDRKTVLKGSKEKERGWFELELDAKDIDCNRDAERACPVSVIHVVE